MTNPSNLRDHHSVLVLDASVALNLLGTGQAARLLQALGRKVVMDEHAIKEIIYDPSNGAPGEHAIADSGPAAGSNHRVPGRFTIRTQFRGRP